MSSPIPPIHGPLGPEVATPSAPAHACKATTFRSELEASRSALAGQADARSPRAELLGAGTPPPELLEEIAAASRTNEQLRASGRQVRFIQDGNGQITIELQGAEGEMLRSLSIAEALDMAAGKPLS
jgi:hypothetical protein